MKYQCFCADVLRCQAKLNKNNLKHKKQLKRKDPAPTPSRSTTIVRSIVIPSAEDYIVIPPAENYIVIPSAEDWLANSFPKYYIVIPFAKDRIAIPFAEQYIVILSAIDCNANSFAQILHCEIFV